VISADGDYEWVPVAGDDGVADAGAGRMPVVR